MAVDFASAWYPYSKAQEGFLTYRGMESIPSALLYYLLDLPDAAGYTPEDDNERPRVRLAKYLWHDGARPLDKTLPTPAQKRGLVFDGNAPAVNGGELSEKHPKGYRLFMQSFFGQAQKEATTTVKCYMGRTVPLSPYKASLGICFEILCNVNQETNTKTEAYARAYAIEQCILEALHGVNIAGIGVVDFSKASHPDCGSRPISDNGTNVGRELKMSILWAESREPEVERV